MIAYSINSSMQKVCAVSAWSVSVPHMVPVGASRPRIYPGSFSWNDLVVIRLNQVWFSVYITVALVLAATQHLNLLLPLVPKVGFRRAFREDVDGDSWVVPPGRLYRLAVFLLS